MFIDTSVRVVVARAHGIWCTVSHDCGWTRSGDGTQSMDDVMWWTHVALGGRQGKRDEVIDSDESKDC